MSQSEVERLQAEVARLTGQRDALMGVIESLRLKAGRILQQVHETKALVAGYVDAQEHRQNAQWQAWQDLLKVIAKEGAYGCHACTTPTIATQECFSDMGSWTTCDEHAGQRSKPLPIAEPLRRFLAALERGGELKADPRLTRLRAAVQRYVEVVSPYVVVGPEQSNADGSFNDDNEVAKAIGVVAKELAAALEASK